MANKSGRSISRPANFKKKRKEKKAVWYESRRVNETFIPIYSTLQLMRTRGWNNAANADPLQPTSVVEEV